jgi:hypothetical protein
MDTDFTTVRYKAHKQQSTSMPVITESQEQEQEQEKMISKTKSTSKRPIKWELALDAAIRCQTMGRIGIELNGRYYSSTEIERLCSFQNPLPPFDFY